MKQTIAFMKKEWMDLVRGSRLLIAGAVFLLFGIMNPALAKLTPALYDLLADQMKEQGMVLTKVEVTAVHCWQQYNKNLSMLLIVFVILFAGILTNEYQKGTLLLVVTKGMPKKGIYFSKLATLCLVWTAGFALMTGMTWFYAGFYWDNSIMFHLPEAIFCIWFFGLLLCCLILFFSAICSNMSGVLLGLGGLSFASFLISMVPNTGKYLPTALSDMTAVMCQGTELPIPALMITILLVIGSSIGGALLMEKRTV